MSPASCGGHVHVLNRQGLENTSCECYGVMRARFDELRR
jgi:hypothetical protein